MAMTDGNGNAFRRTAHLKNDDHVQRWWLSLLDLLFCLHLFDADWLAVVNHGCHFSSTALSCQVWFSPFPLRVAMLLSDLTEPCFHKLNTSNIYYTVAHCFCSCPQQVHFTLLGVAQELQPSLTHHPSHLSILPSVQCVHISVSNIKAEDLIHANISFGFVHKLATGLMTGNVNAVTWVLIRGYVRECVWVYVCICTDVCSSGLLPN